MKLQIEKWINEKDFPAEATNLLNEGIICYKSGAYRASLLFSYLGFEKIIKNRLLNAKRPDNVPEETWENIQKDISDDLKWEETIFTTITGYASMPIFLQDNKKREEMNRHLSYWRDRRNDAAHAKKNEINNAYVETFWSFMQSNIPKLVVRGSRVAILEDIRLHFDVRYTPKGKDFSYIINQIKHSLYEDDLITFFQDINEIFKKVNSLYIMSGDRKLSEFWNEIFNLEKPFSTSLVQYFKSEDGAEVFDIVIQDFPQRINWFYEDPRFIHNLWYERISDYRDPYEILSVLLRNDLIEEKDHVIAIENLVLQLNNQVPSKELEFAQLNQFGYQKVFKKLVFGIDSYRNALVDDFSWGNENLKPVRHYLEYNDLDEETVQSLCRVFKMQPYPNKMCDNLKDFFDKNIELKEKFTKIAGDLNETPPKSLGFDE